MKQQNNKEVEKEDDNTTLVLTFWDSFFLNIFVQVTGFVDILTIVKLLGEPNTFSWGAKIGLSLAAILVACAMAYFGLKKTGVIK